LKSTAPTGRLSLSAWLPLAVVTACLLLAPAIRAATTESAGPPASFARDVRPILNRSCVGCHQPGKLKGKLDLTAYAPFRAGGKTGPAFVPGDPGKSLVVDQISGPEPAMPNKGEHLTAGEVETIARWIGQGAKDDTPVGERPVAPVADGAAAPGPMPPERPTVYRLPPVITALAFSPDGKALAVAGSYEILLHEADGSKLVRRLPSGSPRTATLFYSADGKTLFAAGGAPGQFGQVQSWDVSGDGSDYHPAKNWRVAADLPFGLCLSPSADRIAFGCADRTGRVLSLADGKEQFRVEQHTDWVLGVAFTVDGKTLLTTGRDKALKLSDAATGRPIEQINEPQEPITCAARHPAQDLVAVGGAGGATRLYKISDLQKRTDANRDPNRVKELERLNGPVNAVAFSPDGNLLAVAATGEARVFAVKDGRRVAMLSPGGGNSAGPIFAVAFSPDGKRVAAGGYDGQVRLFDAEKGTLLKSFVPVPLDVPTTRPADQKP